MESKSPGGPFRRRREWRQRSVRAGYRQHWLAMPASFQLTGDARDIAEFDHHAVGDDQRATAASSCNTRASCLLAPAPTSIRRGRTMRWLMSILRGRPLEAWRLLILRLYVSLSSLRVESEWVDVTKTRPMVSFYLRSVRADQTERCRCRSTAMASRSARTCTRARTCASPSPCRSAPTLSSTASTQATSNRTAASTSHRSAGRPAARHARQCPAPRYRHGPWPAARHRLGAPPRTPSDHRADPEHLAEHRHIVVGKGTRTAAQCPRLVEQRAAAVIVALPGRDPQRLDDQRYGEVRGHRRDRAAAGQRALGHGIANCARGSCHSPCPTPGRSASVIPRWRLASAAAHRACGWRSPTRCRTRPSP